MKRFAILMLACSFLLLSVEASGGIFKRGCPGGKCAVKTPSQKAAIQKVAQKAAAQKPVRKISK